MDNSSITDASLRQLYREPIEKTTGTFSAEEVEEDIRIGKQINQEQLDVLNDYWKKAGSQEIKYRPAQQAVVGLPLQTQENVGFFTKLKNNIFGLFSKKSAQGNPVQEQAPQKFTVKQKEADRVRDRIAGRHNPYADHVSYEMLRQKDAVTHEKMNTYNAVREAGIRMPANYDEVMNRTFLNYVHGFKADKDGNPLTEQDERLKKENLDWARRYFSEDEREHFSALDQIVDEILNFNIAPAMLKDDYVGEHFEELNIFSRKLLCVQNLEQDVEINTKYFREAIEPKKEELLRARQDQLTNLTGMAVNYYAMRKGVSHEDGHGYLDDSKESMDMQIAQTGMVFKALNQEEMFNQLAKKEKMVAEFEKRVGKQETKIKKQLDKQSKETKENKTSAGIVASERAQVRSFADGVIGKRMTENLPMVNKYRNPLAALGAEMNKEIDLRDKASIQVAACAELQKEIADRKKKGKNVTPEEEEMEDLARRQESFMLEYRQKQHLQNIVVCGNAMSFFLTGEKLGDDALKLIQRLNLNDDLTAKNEELNSSGTDAVLQQLYQQKILTPTGTFSAQEVEKEIQAGNQISEEQFAVFNNYQTVKRQRENLRPSEGQKQQQQQTASLQTQENSGFFTKLKNMFTGWSSKKSAQGSPVQAQKPETQTVKWGDKNQLRDRIAGNYNPRADHVSYEMVDNIKGFYGMKDNSINEALRQGISLPLRKKTCTRVFPQYLKGYRTNAEGQPATKEDEKRRDADIEWIKNYLSTDKDKRNLALDQVVDDLLRMDIKPAMLKNSYFDSHMDEMVTIVNKLLGITDIQSDGNRDYFAQMDPIKKELLQVRADNFTFLVNTSYMQRLIEKGLADRGGYLVGESDMEYKISTETNQLIIKREEEQNWFAKREQTEKMVADLEKSRKEEEEKSLAGLPRTWKSSYDMDKEEIGVAKNSYALSMESLEESGHVQEYTRDKMLIDMCISGLEKECNLLDASKLASTSYAAAVKPLEKKDNLSPEQVSMIDLASKKANFEDKQSKLHADNRDIYKKAINDLLTGEKPSEEFWKLFEHAHNSMVAKNMRNRIEGRGQR